MPAVVQIVPALRLELVRHWGTVESGDLVGCLQQLDADPRHDRDYALLMDVRDGQSFEINHVMLERIARLIVGRKQAGLHRTARTVLVLPDESTRSMLALSNLFHVQIERFDPELAARYALMPSLDAAIDWLGYRDAVGHAAVVDAVESLAGRPAIAAEERADGNSE